jgi:TFIIF-interacting CTD phosphatase-like protein
LFAYVLSEEHCIIGGKDYIKDLNILIDGTRDLSNIVILDMDMCHFTHHLRNGIFIEPFNESCFEEDRTFELLETYLTNLTSCSDFKK